MTSIEARAPMTYSEIVAAAHIIEAGHKTARWAVWAPGENPADADCGTVLTGCVRYIESRNPATGERAASDDIRDQFLRISTSFEHWLKVSDVLVAMAAGLFVIEN